ncbi:MAG: phosphoenolpyruvate--protein phosphotransferase [Phycisphaerae bacterium]
MKQISKDILGLLCDVGELSARLAGSADLQAFLQQIVEMVAGHLHSDVCSIYLYEEDTEQLVLRATKGLNSEGINNVRLSLEEGLVGMSLRQLRPIRELCASANPNFKAIEGINEEPYESYLAVPILKGVERIGVLVVQREQRNSFSEQDIMALRATASQLASAIETARVLMEIHSGKSQHPPAPVGRPSTPSLIQGRVASKGFAHAPVSIHDPTRGQRSLVTRRFAGTYSLDQLRDALQQTASQLQALQKRVGQRLPEMASLIFDAHQMMLKDHAFVGEMITLVEEGTNPPEAVQQVARKYADLLMESSHTYIREKAQDVEDLARRILANLTGAETGFDLQFGDQPHIVVARELFPSDVLKLVTANIAGVVLVCGGVTSHVSILARSLQMPLVIAQDNSLLSLQTGTEMLLDAEIGNIYIEPGEEIIRTFADRNRARKVVGGAEKISAEQTETADGHHVKLLANINLLTDVDLAVQVGSAGIGLYRSEFPFLIRTALPSEEEQMVIYRRLIDAIGDRELTFRTLDVGGDKLLSYFDEDLEENPALGLRGIRFSLRHNDVFCQQIRALLRAAAEFKSLKIMFPMISSVEEFHQARQVVRQCMSELQNENLPCHTSPTLGIMVEVPSAVTMIDVLAEEVDFFCIGTNDLTQFLLAVDRTNEKVAAHFQPHHPAVLRAVKRVADAANAADKEVSICGEMANEVRFLPLLIGLGIRSISVDPQYLPALAAWVGKLTLDGCRRQAELLLAETTLAGVSSRLGGFENRKSAAE